VSVDEYVPDAMVRIIFASDEQLAHLLELAGKRPEPDVAERVKALVEAEMVIRGRGL
jgi:hypothetical protein